jgi:hypothetical protein
MATPTQIRVMISSRCNDPVVLGGNPRTFTDLRRQLKEELEGQKVFGSQLFDVWINEDAPAEEGSVDAWETCLEQVRRADIVIVLYNGNSGWAKEGGEVGICHEELATALSSAPAKVRMIGLPVQPTKGLGNQRHERFQKYVESQARFWRTAENGDEAVKLVKASLREAVAEMVQLGGREAKKGKYTVGEAMDWSRLDFSRRREIIKSTLRDALTDRQGSEIRESNLFVRVDQKPVLMVCDAIPAAMGVAAAREMVGQPFLRDHELADALIGDRVGPVHVIGCHRSVSEAQAMRQLGFPDATIVSPPFGVYVADPIQKIQLLFLSNCRDETAARHAVQRAFEWLLQSGEGPLLTKRAQGRARIVKAIAMELIGPGGSARTIQRKSRRQ